MSDFKEKEEFLHAIIQEVFINISLKIIFDCSV